MNKCDCNDNGKIRIVSGNDLTVEAVVSVWDAKECVYVPMDLTGASDVALNMVTTFTKVPGEEVSASGSRVSAFFPAVSLGKGVYGVEITFRDADGRCRAFERSLIEVVESSGEATVESTAEGETGEGLNITVDVRTRTVRIGGTGATDYPSLTGKPSINGVVLEGDKTPEELGMYSKEEADKAEVSQLNNGSTVTYSGENDAIYFANSGKEITNLKVTCTTPADPVNPTMDSLKTREAKFMFECGPNAAITFENVQWNDWDAPDFNTASHCICEISIMYVSGLKKFIGRYTTYPPTHLTQPSWSLENYTTFGATDSPFIEVTDNDNVGWKAEYPDWMSAEGGIDSGTGSGDILFQCTNDGAARDGYMTLKSADGRKVFVKCYVMQEGVQP